MDNLTDNLIENNKNEPFKADIAFMISYNSETEAVGFSAYNGDKPELIKDQMSEKVIQLLLKCISRLLYLVITGRVKVVNN